MAEIPIQRKEGRNIWPLLLGLLVLLALLWFIFGRNRNNNSVATTDSTTTTASNGMAGGSDSSAMGGSGANGSSGANGASGTGAGTVGSNGMNGSSPVPASARQMTDPEIFSMLAAVNQGEIDAGKIAQSKASSAQVKSFANDMVTAHSNMTKQNGKMAAALGAVPQPAANDSIVMGNTQAASTLRSTAAGPAFDQAYVQSQVMAHQRALSFLQQAQSQAQNADLKNMISQAIPDVQKHLDRARSLQGQSQGQSQ